ncbi:MAG TPA: hypothetical protein VNO79_05975 [Actinomycetota bacterium]|nr:hypothetical protein [Actinomycetota bacterium]
MRPWPVAHIRESSERWGYTRLSGHLAAAHGIGLTEQNAYRTLAELRSRHLREHLRLHHELREAR